MKGRVSQVRKKISYNIYREKERRKRVVLAGVILCFCALVISQMTALKIPVVTAASASMAETELYAKGAVLLDGESGRVLYGKNHLEQMPMASTTKIMTCILVLENAGVDETVNVSGYAASMPAVKLSMKKGESYTVRDLLYSLMLESHNDTAVALAEHVGKKLIGGEVAAKNPSECSIEESKQAVAAFAGLMNEKAKEIGCENTWYITPNGLDATEQVTENDEVITKTHATTATDLARVMRYCTWQSAQSESFLQITGRSDYTFTANGRSFSLVNHNAFLNMMEGAVSGKTGFTGNAGYCYVGALQQGDKKLVVALLACGWPNNKTYKWSDTKKLMQYGLNNYRYLSLENEVFYYDEKMLPMLQVHNAATRDWAYEVSEPISIRSDMLPDYEGLLLTEEEEIVVEVDCIQEMQAPVKAGQVLGEIRYLLGEELIKREKLVVSRDVAEIDYKWCFKQVTELYFGQWY